MQLFPAKKIHLNTRINSGFEGAYDKKEIEKYGKPKVIAEWKIDALHNTKLNKLKKSNPEAFFYWYKAIELNKDV